MTQQPPPQGPWRPPASPQGQPWSPSAPSQWPNAGQPQHGNGQWQDPRSTWAPQQPGTQPLQQEYQSVSINDYQLPKSNAKWWLAGVSAVVIAGLVAAAVITSRPEQPPITTSSTPTPSVTQGPSVQVTGNAVAFVSSYDNAEGFWEILDQKWTDRGLELILKITVTKGNFRYSLFCLDNKTTDDFDPVEISDANALPFSTLGAGETASGLVVFEKDRGDTMVYLATGFGRQISALPAKG
ncbi:hypothetical protein ACQCX5_13285 [Propionibacteriaceae bacterium G57]|uniref:hypothetical protein n=1 Tax=Aestuariimicrobium sp. G57 TaxID=3418485 RepID=UPI003DA6F5D2